MSPVSNGDSSSTRRAAPGAWRPKRNSPGDKLFGKYDELVRLVLGFVLTELVGTYLAQTYTTRQANLATAGKIFSDYSKLLGDRYFGMNQP